MSQTDIEWPKARWVRRVLVGLVLALAIYLALGFIADAWRWS